MRDEGVPLLADHLSLIDGFTTVECIVMYYALSKLTPDDIGHAFITKDISYIGTLFKLALKERLDENSEVVDE